MPPALRRNALWTWIFWFGCLPGADDNAIPPAPCPQFHKATGPGNAPPARPAPLLSPEEQGAVLRGVGHLLAAQRDDGSWDAAVGYMWKDEYARTNRGPHVGITALCALALLGAGTLEGAPDCRGSVEAAKAFLLSKASANSGMITHIGTRMYSHALAGILLVETCPPDGDGRSAAKVADALSLTLASDNGSGGYGYLPFAHGADISNTAFQYLFLVCAARRGYDVPPDALERVRGFVRMHEVLRPRKDAHSFRYETGERSRANFATTAKGLTCLLAPASDPALEPRAGLAYLLEHFNDGGVRLVGRKDSGFLCGLLFGALAFQHGDPELRPQWRQRVSAFLLDTRREDGTWLDCVGREYATAVAVLILSAPLRGLTMFRLRD